MWREQGNVMIGRTSTNH